MLILNVVKLLLRLGKEGDENNKPVKKGRPEIIEALKKDGLEIIASLESEGQANKVA